MHIYVSTYRERQRLLLSGPWLSQMNHPVKAYEALGVCYSKFYRVSDKLSSTSAHYKTYSEPHPYYKAEKWKVIYHLIPTWLFKQKKKEKKATSDNIKDWKERRQIGNLINGWWENKLVITLENSLARSCYVEHLQFLSPK